MVPPRIQSRMPIKWTPTGPALKPATGASPAALATWAARFADYVHRNLATLATQLGKAPLFESTSVPNQFSGDRVVVGHGLKAIPRHVSITVEGGQGVGFLVETTAQSVTIEMVLVPGGEPRTVHVAVFA